MSGFTVCDETAIFQMCALAGNVKHSFSTTRAPFAAIYYKEQVFDLWNFFKGEHAYKLIFIHCCPFILLPKGPQICLFRSDTRKITDTFILSNSRLRALVGSSAFLKFSWKCDRPMKLVYREFEVKPIMSGF